MTSLLAPSVQTVLADEEKFKKEVRCKDFVVEGVWQMDEKICKDRGVKVGSEVCFL